jgi:hypothetical protein
MESVGEAMAFLRTTRKACKNACAHPRLAGNVNNKALKRAPGLLRKKEARLS